MSQLVDLVGGPGDGAQVPVDVENMPKEIDIGHIFGYSAIYKEVNGSYEFVGYGKDENEE